MRNFKDTYALFVGVNYMYIVITNECASSGVYVLCCLSCLAMYLLCMYVHEYVCKDLYRVVFFCLGGGGGGDTKH